jgi:peptidoglycan/LPS O-acetylase OafA/YrhL
VSQASVSDVVKKPTASGSYVPEVDALRCLAMTAVIAMHCGLFPIGWMGVWLFFVVSGFAVTTSLMSARNDRFSVWARIRSFYGRRALRIWPIYFAYVAAGFAFLIALGQYGMLRQLPWLLTFTQNIEMIIASYAPGTFWGGFGHLWTLSVEQQFYVVFPFLLFLPGRRIRSLALLGVILLAPLIRYATARWAVAHGMNDISTAFAVYAFGPAQFDAFAVGALIAMWRDKIEANRQLTALSAFFAAAVTSAFVVTYIIINSRIVGHVSVDVMRNILSGILFGQGREIWVYFIPSSVGAALLIGLLAGEPHYLRFCRLPGLQAIGRISYGGYLFHIPVLMTLGAAFPIFRGPVLGPASYVAHILMFICAYAITVCVAWLSFTYVEQRFTQLGRRRPGRPMAH